MVKHPKEWNKEIKLERIKDTYSNKNDEDYKKAVKFNVKKIKEIYSGEKKASYYQSKTYSAGGSYWSIDGRDSLETLMRNAYNSPSAAAAVAKMLHSYDPNFAKIISYFSDMFYIRYTVLPIDAKVQTEEETDEENFMLQYKTMLSVVDNSHLEVNVPNMLQELYLSGAIYLYATKYKPANSVSILALPQKYCRPIYSTNHGTIVFQFDFSYFDNTSNAEQRDALLKLFPREFLKLYSEYLNDGIKWKKLNPKFSSAIMLNESGITPYLDIMSDIINYKEFKQNDLVKSRNQLKQILTHKIPLYENRMIFEFDEVAEIQKAIGNIINRHEGMETITVFGETELLRLQDDGKVENKQVSQSYSNVYNSAGINPNIMNSNTQESLSFSFSIDKASVIRHINSIETFYNVVINNLYNFKPYEAKLKLLHISVKDEKEDVKNYQEAAKFGIGKIDAIVASGVKQNELIATKRLEDAIDIHSILTPLQSSHTTSEKGEESKQEETEEEKSTVKKTEDE